MSYFYPRCVVLLQPVLRPEAAGSAQTLSIPVIPMSASFTSDEPSRADTAEIVIPFDSMPFDPRAIADMRVAVYMGDVEDPRVDLTSLNTGTARFVGFADTPAVDFTRSGSTVTIRARSYEGRLLDTRFSRPVLDAGGPLSALVKSIVTEIPFYADLPIDVQDDTPLATRISAKRWTPPERATVWDVIAALARATGQEAFFDRDRLVIREPLNASSERTRIVAQGYQIGEFSLETGFKPVFNKAIELTAHNARTGKPSKGRYPQDAALETLSFPVGGDLDDAALNRQAEALWKQYSRRVVEGRLETRAMKDAEGEDLCALRAGDALFVRSWSDSPGYVLGKSAAQLAAFMTGEQTPPGIAYSQGAQWVSRDDADKLSKAIVASDQVAPLFFVRRCTHTFDASGYRLSVTFENIVGETDG